MKQELVDLASYFISIPGYVELEEKESKMAMALFDTLKRWGLPASIIDIGGRYNVSCTYEGSRPGPKVILCTHLDTVPAYGMENPFKATIKDGKLYGRGAVDVRDILAAMALVLKKLFDQKPDIAGSVELLAVADEESGSFGMRQALKNGLTGDLVIVGEPTDLVLGVAHKGVAWLQYEFKGISAHGSVPDEGHNAVYDAVAFINNILNKKIPELRTKIHPLLGHGTINVGLMQGGTRPTIVPDYCQIQIDRRLLPGEVAEQELEYLSREGNVFQAEVIKGDKNAPYPPLDSSSYRDTINVLQKSINKILGKVEAEKGLPFWTDAALPAAKLNIPAVVFGPGNIAQAHSINEFVEIKDLEAAYDIYYQMILDYCS